VNIDLELLNHTTLISVYPYWLDTTGLVYLGLLQALVVIPMLVQSYRDAFLATVMEVKESLCASPQVLFRCCFSSRPTSRSSLALVPLVVRSAPPILEDFPSRHMAVAPRLPRIGPLYIYCGDRARRAYPSFCYITTQLHLYMIVTTSAVVSVLLGYLTSVGSLT